MSFRDDLVGPRESAPTCRILVPCLIQWHPMIPASSLKRRVHGSGTGNSAASQVATYRHAGRCRQAAPTPGLAAVSPHRGSLRGICHRLRRAVRAAAGSALATIARTGRIDVGYLFGDGVTQSDRWVRTIGSGFVFGGGRDPSCVPEVYQVRYRCRGRF